MQAELVALGQQREALLAAEQAREQARGALTTEQAVHKAAALRLQEAQAARAVVDANQSGYTLYVAAQERRASLDISQQERQQLQLQQGRVAASLALAEEQARLAEEQIAQIAKAEATVASLAVPAARQSALEERRGVAQAQQGELRGAQSALQQAERSLAQEIKNLEAVQAAAATRPTIQADLARIEGELTRLGKQKAKLDDERSNRMAEGLACKAQNEKLAEVQGATCPVCSRPLTAEHRKELLAQNEAEMERLRPLLRAANDNVTALQGELDALDALRRKQEAALHKLPTPAAVEEQAKRVEQLRAQCAAGTTRCAELAEAPETLRTIEAELLALGNPRQQIAVAHATVQKRANVEAALAQAQAQAALAQESLAALDVMLQAFASLDADLAAVQEALESHLAAYQAVLSNRQSAATVEQHAAEVAHAAQACATLETAFSAAQQVATEAAQRFDGSAYTRAQSESGRLNGEVGSLANAEVMLAREAATLAGQIADLQGEQAKLRDAQASVATLDEQGKTLKRLRDVIKQAGPYVTAHLIQQVSLSAAQLFGELTGDYTRLLKWGDDYGISLEVDGRTREFASLSGGEQMIAALSVRLALLKTVSGISVAFFDEPTANLDGPRRDALATQLRSFSGLRQLFVISHDDTFEHLTNNTIHLARVDGVSQLLDGGMSVRARAGGDEL